ncbi:MAG TPA: pilus assembly PilX N-terminal domain-containing protein [Blastocatellia bacterium]|jgi:Tfp pilus assembly protein PilX|nr:pilus assembly PilX N-terminal domain-containing protein [Blastocatellia bacterium]
MIDHEKNRHCEDRRQSEGGIALVTALLVSTILLGLGMAVVFSATTDTSITRSQRVSEQAFFAADAGIALGRRALARAVEEEFLKISNGTANYGNRGYYSLPNIPANGALPYIEVIPDPVTSPNYQFYTNVKNRVGVLTQAAGSKTRLDALNGTSYEVAVVPTSRLITFVPDAANPSIAREDIRINYSIKVTGRTNTGASAVVVETGRMTTSFTLTNTAVAGTDRAFSFSGFGAFFDNGDTTASNFLAAGTFKGPVHTNSHFSFDSGRTVNFANLVSQVDDYIRYDSTNFSQGHKAIPTADVKGINISSEGYKRTDAVPLPDNNFSQEYAVINGTGIRDLKSDGTPVDPPGRMPVDAQGKSLAIFDSSGRVTPDALAVNLRDASNAQPVVSGNGSNRKIADGVYVSSSDGSTIGGAGIYVQGNAEIQLKATGTNNADQLYLIKQGSTTTTVRVNAATNQTVITAGSKTRTYTGVPTDKSNPLSPKPGVSLFVNGSITSLRGGVEGSTKVPALAPSTALTITAQRDIVVTGDIKYSDAVVDALGDPVANYSNKKNVLGLFTNDGNVELNPNSSYVAGGGLSLEMHAAVVAFNKSTSNDGSGEIEGSITFTGDTTKLSSSDKWTLVGSRVQAKINNIGFSTRNVFFDVRFQGGTFSPPFFPGTKYTLGKPAVNGSVVLSGVGIPTATGVNWYRENK